MPDPFHVDAPEDQAAPAAPPVADGEARDDTHAALAAALHVPPDEVKPAEEDNLAANRAFERGETVLLKDMVAEHTRTGAPFIGNPSWAGEAIPSPPPKAQVAQAAPVHPFADRARISQSIKMAIAQATSGFPDVEVEGLHILAQLVSQIVTSEPDKAREIWMQLGKHCDDVAAALR